MKSQEQLAAVGSLKGAKAHPNRNLQPYKHEDETLFVPAYIRCSACGELKWVGHFASDYVIGLVRGHRTRIHCKLCHRVVSRATKARVPVEMRKLMDTAHRLVALAIKQGILVPGPCQIGSNCRGKVVAHHDDYTKPYDVRWLCRRHHCAYHKDNPTQF